MTGGGVRDADTLVLAPRQSRPPTWTGRRTSSSRGRASGSAGSPLQANPTVWEVLWSPLVEEVTDDGRQLLAIGRAFLWRRVADTYGRYAQDQLDRVAARRQPTGQTNHKQAMHMIRLLHAGGTRAAH